MVESSISNRQDRARGYSYRLFKSFDPRMYEQWVKAADRINIRPVVDLVFLALDAFSESELERKYAVRSEILEIPQAGTHRAQRSDALNLLGIARLRLARAAIREALKQNAKNKNQIDRLNAYVASDGFRESVTSIYIPDFRHRLLESTGAPEEVRILAAELLSLEAWQQNLGDIYGQMDKLVADLSEVRSTPDRGNLADEATGVQTWKVIGTKLIGKLVHVIIGFACADIPVPIIDVIACAIGEAVWGWVWQYLEEKIWGWCRDPKPARPKPRRVS
jgi:hypothetical protein